MVNLNGRGSPQIVNHCQPYPTPCLQRRELASLGDYSFYVQKFLTRARCTRHAVQKHCVDQVIFWKSVIK